MKNMIKRFWNWLVADDVDDGFHVCVLKYSDLIEKYPLNGEVGDDDILHISHKLENGRYETCYIRVSDLKKALQK